MRQRGPDHDLLDGVLGLNHGDEQVRHQPGRLPRMSFLAELRAGDARLGGKARSLAALAEQGLATPPGFAVTDALFRALCPSVPAFARLDPAAFATLDGLRAKLMQAPRPAGFRDELHARLGAVGATRFAVRSSFASEDIPGQLAAGVYESCLDVALPDVEKAIRRVLCSALAPGAVAYAMAHGQPSARDPVAVLVHAFLPGQAEGSAAFAPGRMAEPLVTLRGGQLPVEPELVSSVTTALIPLVRDTNLADRWRLQAPTLVIRSVENTRCNDGLSESRGFATKARLIAKATEHPFKAIPEFERGGALAKHNLSLFLVTRVARALPCSADDESIAHDHGLSLQR
jgi:pyruvate,water dikinase